MRRNTGLRVKRKPIGVKLLVYFTLYAAAILSALWILQIVLLQNFYEGMKIREIEQVAGRLSGVYGQNDFEYALDKAAYANAMLVYVTDSSGGLRYTTDEHGASRRWQGKGMRRGLERSLPSDYDEFLARLSQSASGTVSYTVQSEALGGKSLIVGTTLPGAVLYMSASLDPVDATVSILRTQLIYVTAAALMLGIVVAAFIARRFSRPVAAITAQAQQMATQHFPTSFDRGFCAELDELADALTHAGVELNKVEMLRRELLANISHDLRTPLTMIKAYTEMIRDISGENKQRREAHLAVIGEEADRLTELVNDILALSSIQSGGETLSLGDVDVSAQVLSVVSHFEPVFAREGLSIRAEVEPGLHARADVQRLGQVLYNLIANAMNYAGEDGLVEVRARREGSLVRVEVVDHGEGIPEEELPLIWARYYKSRAQKRGKAGAGLGLSIVKGILDMHSARYGVHSRVGEGSTFWFELGRPNPGKRCELDP